MRNGLVIAATCLTLAAALHAQAPSAKPEPPTHDVRVELDQTSTGIVTFAVDKAGKVTGTMHLDQPNVVDATLGGTIKDGVWTFDYPFSMPGPGCTGKAAGTAKVAADLATISGTVSISGECVPQPVSGTFMFTKKK